MEREQAGSGRIVALVAVGAVALLVAWIGASYLERRQAKEIEMKQLDDVRKRADEYAVPEGGPKR